MFLPETMGRSANYGATGPQMGLEQAVYLRKRYLTRMYTTSVVGSPLLGMCAMFSSPYSIWSRRMRHNAPFLVR